MLLGTYYGRLRHVYGHGVLPHYDCVDVYGVLLLLVYDENALLHYDGGVGFGDDGTGFQLSAKPCVQRPQLHSQTAVWSITPAKSSQRYFARLVSHFYEGRN